MNGWMKGYGLYGGMYGQIDGLSHFLYIEHGLPNDF